MIKFIDICSGIGGGRLGLSKAGFECVGYSEINSNAINTYIDFFDKEEVNYGDVTQINISSLPSFDLLIAGFPCQTFSIVGKRKGFDDERGKIIFRLAEILKRKKPKYFIFENVKGLVNLNKGTVLKDILLMLESSGYYVSYDVLDSLDFGVPQQRERIYFFGVRKDLKSQGFKFSNIKKSSKVSSIEKFIFDDNSNLALSESGSKHTSFIKFLNNKYNIGKWYIKDLVKQDYLVIDYRQSDLRIYKNKVPTLRAGRHGILYSKDGELKFLNGKDALLLQGFNRNLINKLYRQSNTTLLSLAGNAMTVNVIESIAKELRKLISE